MQKISPSPTESRYHHFIPQFILRNFAHPYYNGKASRKKRRPNNGIYLGDKVVNAIDLSKPVIELVEMKVARTFGVSNLYVDVEHPENEQHIEEMFSKLENSAAQVISKIRIKFESGAAEVALKRSERDTIRKFLYLMEYRKPAAREWFSGESADAYKGADKEEFIEYMRKRGFRKPIEVWLDNIKAILEVRMSIDTQWEEELNERLYKRHAFDFITHTKAFYLSFCTPSNAEDEFVMTENGYGIHEGPVNIFTNPTTGDARGVFTQFHLFAHISPRLTIVLRSFMLPLPEEDVNLKIKAERAFSLMLCEMQHQSNLVSFLADLPLAKPRNSYTSVINGRLVSLAADGIPVLSQSDVFYFRFFRLSVVHVSKINIVLLEEAYPTSFIVFNNKLAVRRAIEQYLCFEDKDFGFKSMTKTQDDPRLVYLQKLVGAVEKLGGVAVMKYISIEKATESNWVRTTNDGVFKLIKDDKYAMEIYTRLSEYRTSLSKQERLLSRIY